MIVKIMQAAGSSFPGVNYNSKKVDGGKGELMLMKNFPASLNEGSGPQEVRDYLRSVSKNEKVKKPQFHAVISTKFQAHTKEELTEIADSFMQEMGYGKQPFIVVFHNDTENNHVHLVSTRVDKKTGKKINDSYERLKAQKALANALEKFSGIAVDQELEKLLKYRIGSIKQFEMLLERSGFRVSENRDNEKELDILKNGVRLKTIEGSQIRFSEYSKDSRRLQLKAILSKYKGLCSNKVFKVEDRRRNEGLLPEEKHKNWKPTIEFESELQKKMRDVFGIDLVFHQKDGQKPFGYSLIDHKTATVYKGSEIMKMNELFEFTDERIDKKLFESLKEFNVSSENSKKALLEYLRSSDIEGELKDFMIFQNRKYINKENYSAIREDVRSYLKDNNNSNDKIKVFRAEDGKRYAIHLKMHFIQELDKLIGEKQYSHPSQIITNTDNHKDNTFEKQINEFLFEMTKSSGGVNDSIEDEIKKRKKRKKR